jgi:biopolymer transport protein ExbD
MRFPRRAKILCGLPDAAALASVAFLTLILLLLTSSLVYTPGVRVDLPPASAPLPGAQHPAVVVALDRSGQLYYQNQILDGGALKARLEVEVKRSRTGLTLVLQADKAAAYENIVRVAQLARDAGIKETFLATRPGPFSGKAP